MKKNVIFAVMLAVTSVAQSVEWGSLLGNAYDAAKLPAVVFASFWVARKTMLDNSSAVKSLRDEANGWAQAAENSNLKRSESGLHLVKDAEETL